MLKRISGALFALLMLTGIASPSGVLITVTYGANFYGQEEWDPGKLRRWMRNNGEIFLTNESSSVEVVNVRFYAEAFQIPRELYISMDGRLLAQWATQPHSQRYIVIKALVLAPGRHRMVFHTPQVPSAPLTKSTTERELSIAFSPFSVIPANSPEAQGEWTAPFANGPTASKYFTPLENIAYNLRREGRFSEAARADELAMANGATEYVYLLHGMTLLTLDRRTEAAQAFQRCMDLPGAGLRRAWVRSLCRQVKTYMAESPILLQSDRDPGRRARAEGKLYEAVETYEQMAAKAPDAVQAHYWLGIIDALAERRAESRVHLERVIALVGDTPDGRFLRTLQPYF